MSSNNHRRTGARIHGAPTPAPTPILKSSSNANGNITSNNNNTNANTRKRRHQLDPSSIQLSVEFSEEVSVMPTQKNDVNFAATTAATTGALKEEEEEDESDTDIGSHLDDSNEVDTSFSFDYGEEEGDDVPTELMGDVNNCNNIMEGGTAATTSSASSSSKWIPSSVSRVNAKVRRLNLDDDGNYTRGGRSSDESNNNSMMDVKRAIAIARSSFQDSSDEEGNIYDSAEYSSPARKLPHGKTSSSGSMKKKGGGLFGNSGNAQSPMSRSAAGLFGSPPPSPRNEMPVCPPSSTKKGRGGVSRLFTDTTALTNDNKINMDEEEEDDSPRDVVDFPFFGSPSDNNNKKAGKENKSLVSVRDMNYNHERKYNNLSPQSPPSTTKKSCPPSTTKKSRSRLFELDNDTSSSNNMIIVAGEESTSRLQRPGGLKAHGRANSFLQMFSQDIIMEEDDEGLKGIHEETAGSDGGSEEDFMHRGKLDRNGSIIGGSNMDFMHRGKLDRNGSIVGGSNRGKLDRNGSIIGGTKTDITACSPKRPMRSHHKSRLPMDYNPASPTDKQCDLSPNSNSFSRFLSDFEIVGTLGDGAFGSVYSVRNRTDKRLYAIKAAKREARGVSDRNRMLQEVYALAALSDKACMSSIHIVRYHQAWMEGNRLYIQTELCESTLLAEMNGCGIGIGSSGAAGAAGGNAKSGVGKSGETGGVLTDVKRRYKLLREMLLALDLVHKSGMIHLDIKPDNIFIKNGQYKLGDFGLVSKIENHDDVEEGDSRYMSRELLSGDLDDLTKSDIFSLGATMYEICLGRSQNLPDCGQEWQDIRHGILLPMPNTPYDMQMIIREMLSPEWRTRPSAEELLKKRSLLSDEQRQLIVERNKATAANKALDAQMQRFKSMSPNNGGRKFNRSNTIC